MVAKKLMNVHKALEFIENFDVSLEDDLSDGNISLGAGDKEEVVGPSVDVTSKRNKGSKVNAFL